MSNEYSSPQLWRLNLKSQAKKDVNPQDFAIKEGIAGVGWRVEGSHLDSESYMKLGEAKYSGPGQKGWRTAMNAFHFYMKEGDLIWTRNADGIYHLGQITGDWKYETSHKHLEADLVNIRPCIWFKVGTIDKVPGKVVASFRASAAVQQVHDKMVNKYSQALYNTFSKKEHYKVVWDQGHDFLKSALSADDWEDLAGLYLQSQLGYLLIPSTCKKSTLKYEFVLLDRENGERAVIQVKSGKTSISPKDFKKLADQEETIIFMLDSVAQEDDSVGNIRRLLADEVLQFAREYRHLMPEKIGFWMEQEENMDHK